MRGKTRLEAKMTRSVSTENNGATVEQALKGQKVTDALKDHCRIGLPTMIEIVSAVQCIATSYMWFLNT